jgi:hypothetical protein
MTQPAAGHPATYPNPTRVASIFLLFLLSACSEPFIVMAGEELVGAVKDAPPDWTSHNEVDIVQIETRPSEPYSVNVWMAGIGPDIYIATGSDDTNWTEHLAENPDIRIRIDGDIFELEATKVTDNRERRTVVGAYVEKYDLDPEDNWVLDDGQIFRLDRR